jgi:integrase
METDTLIGPRDRAVIALLVYSFSRVGAAVKMRVEDFYTQGRRGWVRLYEKGGQRHEMPAHHNLDNYLEEYIAAAGIRTRIGCHTFRATGITAYLKNGGKLEIAQQMAAHESSRTTGLYDWRGDEVSLDEVERIGI